MDNFLYLGYLVNLGKSEPGPENQKLGFTGSSINFAIFSLL